MTFYRLFKMYHRSGWTVRAALRRAWEVSNA
jgi:hypothetical protein